MFRRIACAASLLIVMLAGCTDTESKSSEVEFETSLGNFVVKTWADKAPVTAENFVQYVVDGHYDGLTFHRIAPGFVVQGGGFLPDHQTLRQTRDPIVNEASITVKNTKWSLSMARTNAPDSATSQFFINLKDNAALDKTAGSAGYAVFGEVISGFDVIEAMTNVEAGQSFGSAGGHYPAEPIVIISATVISGYQPEPSPPPTPADIGVDTITPGKFHVTSTTDRILVWAANSGQMPGSIAWNLTSADGSALPEGWSATFTTASQTVAGSDASHTMLTLTVPADATGTHELLLGSGDATAKITATVALDGERLSKEGDKITPKYRGFCTDGGKQFDAGQFQTTLGRGETVPGFDYGLRGLAQGEKATLVLPGQLAYGTSGSRTGCADGALSFEVEILSFDN